MRGVVVATAPSRRENINSPQSNCHRKFEMFQLELVSDQMKSIGS
jgi:hypothetical protein